MSQVNFVEQFNLFMLYARRNKLTSYERIFYLGLFHCANDLARQTENFEWPDDYFPVSNIELNGWTGFDERAIRNTRNSLKQKGLLNFQKGDGKKSDPMYRIFYLRKTGYKIAPDVAADEATGDKSAGGQGIGGENAGGQGIGGENAGGQGIESENAPDKAGRQEPPANPQSIETKPATNPQPIAKGETPIACEFAPDYVGDPVGDTVGDPVGGHVVTDCESAAEHYINKLNVNSNPNVNTTTTLPEQEPGAEPPANPQPVAAAPMENPELGSVMSFYMDNFASIPSLIAVGGLKDFTERLGADVVIHAMQIAQAEQKRSWAYIRGILNRYAREGLTSMVAVRQSEQDFEDSKARKARSDKEARKAPESPRGGGLVDLSAGYGGNKGLVPGLGSGRW